MSSHGSERGLVVELGVLLQVGSLAKAGEAHHLAAMVADAAGLPERRDTEAEAWLRTTVGAPKSAGVSPTPRPEAESPVAAAIAAI
mmetsp:Transcript_16403/g.29253  ORF Transcript_16403/g.29253 Transcript_16403/m.29253 type:complete len:86 (+) Transcript_16403:614-871(+)